MSLRPSVNPPVIQRVVFIDALRLIATFQMVQGHTLDAVLDVAVRVGPLHDMWQRARGLTAVSFLFAAGLAFQQTTLARWNAHRGNPLAGRRRVVRALRLMALGYLLHLPLALLWIATPTERAHVMADFLSVDVLQCVGLSLLGLEMLARWLPRASTVAWSAALVGTLALGLAPWTQTLPVEGPASVIAAYVSAQGGSIFPLLPWAAHLCLGVAIAHWARGRWVAGLSVASVVLGGLGALTALWPVLELTSTHLLRLATVNGVCAVLALVFERASRLPAWMERLAGETLAVYVFHILLVYGAGVGLAAQLGARLSLTSAMGVTLVVLVLSLAVALGWRRWLRRPGLAAPAGKR